MKGLSDVSRKQDSPARSKSGKPESLPLVGSVVGVLLLRDELWAFLVCYNSIRNNLRPTPHPGDHSS